MPDRYIAMEHFTGKWVVFDYDTGKFVVGPDGIAPLVKAREARQEASRLNRQENRT